MEALLWLILGCLCLVGAAIAAIADGKWTPRVAVLGAGLLLAGGVLLAIFVFSGDPYANGEVTRWSRRESHDLVYLSWVATVLGAAWLLALSRGSRSRWVVPTSLLIATVFIISQAVAAASQNLN